MVKGVLYLWARNAGNAQLAWSGDHGQTWTWSDWKFTTSFGCPTFLNFRSDGQGRPLPVGAERGQRAAGLVRRSRSDLDVERLEVHDEFRLSDLPEFPI